MTRPSSLLKIPRNRIGALIGHNASTKELIERKLGVQLNIDSESGDIEINLAPETTDPSMLFRAKEIVLAIGRGFSPEKAQRLLDDEEAMLRTVDLREYVGKSESDIKRLSGRVIGRDGKTRRIIEELSGCELSIYGNTVSIIGDLMELDAAKRAVEMILEGSEHAAVYRFLEGRRRDLKFAEMSMQ